MIEIYGYEKEAELKLKWCGSKKFIKNHTFE